MSVRQFHWENSLLRIYPLQMASIRVLQFKENQTSYKQQTHALYCV